MRGQEGYAMRLADALVFKLNITHFVHMTLSL